MRSQNMRRIATILLLLTALVSCSKIDIFTGISGQEGGREGGRATKTGGDTEEIYVKNHQYHDRKRVNKSQ